ncbi:MAG TPA: heavy metal translocating P-type ATPase, partial [Kiloniellales bacterium]|nr:heavy metal translocating P-type ATPase [Kiloniellales bacterium]
MAALNALDASGALPELERAPDPAPFVRRTGNGTAELNLVIENLHCPSCIPRIEGALSKRPGVLEARVNLSTRRLRIRWRDGETEPRTLLEAITDQGFRLAPFDPVGVETGGESESRALLRALAVAGFAAGNVMLLSVSVWSGLASDMGSATRALMHWVSALIALPAIAYSIRPFLGSALGALRAGRLNMDVPISLAVILAAGMSFFETLRNGEHVYFDAAVMLLFFLLIGRYLDLRVRGRARSAAENLLLLRAKAATVIGDDRSRRALPIAEVSPGMRVAVAPGEHVPVDGRVVAGRSEIDTGLVTGESLPRPVAPGAEVFAGTLNLAGPLEVEVTAADEGTLLAEIVRLMDSAEQGRARYVRLADRIARIYAPVVHLLAAGTFLGWLLLGGVGWQAALLIAIAVLIITCPCALGLAVPAVQVAAVGRLIRRGVLVKAPDALERLAAADCVVFDKTGTLTLGWPELAEPERVAPADLRTAAALAAGSRHPLARALCRAAGPVPALAAEVREEPGRGLAASVEGGELRLGAREWCGVVDEQGGEGAVSELWLTGPGRAPVRFAFRDRIRPDAARTVAWLKAQGLHVALLSGDRKPVVRAAAAALGIEDWRAECRPADKIARVEDLARDGRRVLMVGDGLNDAPALAAAFVSASPAEAADISQTAADLI